MREMCFSSFLKIWPYVSQTSPKPKTVHKRYMSKLFAIHLCKPPKNIKTCRKQMHPETHLDLTTAMIEKQCFVGIDCGNALHSRNAPTMTP